MNIEKTKLTISDKELIEYLNITHKILIAARTELDIERIQVIINALKKNEYEIIHEEINTGLSLKKDAQVLINYLDKIQNKEEVSREEIDMFKEYYNNNLFMKLAVDQSFEEFYSILSNTKNITKNELIIVYKYLIGKDAGSKRLDRMIDEIKQHIYKIKNFNDMDTRFAEMKKY
ncbi:hypothetical protein [Clostridium sp.]|uniref:hypothetical protein n=1 Tax=Clostridium sp. TaxID=1506 RepID=UPI00258A11E6|nr:hypothetical protein [Clostridium sp.]